MIQEEMFKLGVKLAFVEMLKDANIHGATRALARAATPSASAAVQAGKAGAKNVARGAARGTARAKKVPWWKKLFSNPNIAGTRAGAKARASVLS